MIVLKNGQVGSYYRIIECFAEPRTKNKLETLGLVTGSTLQVISNTRAGLILKVKESRLAISSDLALSLAVEP